jgi:hypothetical protein
MEKEHQANPSIMGLVITNLNLMKFPGMETIAETTFFSAANHRLSDAIWYHLFLVLDPLRAKRLFRSVYPPHDPLSKREFRVLLFQWLEEIKPHLKGISSLRKSVLEDGRGERQVEYRVLLIMLLE